MKHKIGLIYFLFLISTFPLAYCTICSKFSEVLVINKDNLVGGYRTKFFFDGVDMASNFFANTLINYRKCKIFYENKLTKIKSCQNAFLEVDKPTARRSFRSNFALEFNRPNLMDLFISNDCVSKDLVVIPEEQRDDISCSLLKGGWIHAFLRGKSMFSSSYQKISSLFREKILDKDDEIGNFKQNDRDREGVYIVLIAIIIVFGCFLVLYFIVKLTSKVFIWFSTRRTIKVSEIVKKELKNISLPTGEIFAAIAIAIYEATEMHDEENAVVTIKNIAKNYSPWSSKIYTLRETPHKK